MEAGGQLVVHGSGGVSENEELGEYLLSIVQVFLCCKHSLRKYGKKRGTSQKMIEKNEKVAPRGTVIRGRKIRIVFVGK